jgi:nitrogenase iron protein NifH
MGTEKIKRIAIYGRNDVGKTTISAHISVALARTGYRILLVGCGCKPDSVVSSRKRDSLPTLLERMKEHPATSPAEVVREGYAGVFRLETGAPSLGDTSPDTSIMSAVERINESGLFERLNLDYVIYNVQGDEAGGGFTTPIRRGLFQDIFTVMSAELKSVRAANSLFELIEKYSERGGARVGGIIANFMDAPYSRDLIDDFAEKTATNVLAYLPSSSHLQSLELKGNNTLEMPSDPSWTEAFANLALKIATRDESLVPHPLEPDDIWKFYMKWNTRFAEMETGEGAGAGI